jgi:type II secretory pathway pseudopilin PulG
VKTKIRQTHDKRAFTLLEMTVVIMVLMTLVGISMYSIGSISSWRKGRDASDKLLSVQTAQRLYLSDHPTTDVGTLTAEMLIPYLPDRSTSIPTVTSLEDAELSIKLNVFPPIVVNSSGTPYDPSGNNQDSLWDVGE